MPLQIIQTQIQIQIQIQIQMNSIFQYVVVCLIAYLAKNVLNP
uniref:Uncharacterized protein n=1 Tax=viral metagenome TaxID=1070528 RepID=A0A6C0LZL0_9ZZZZ